MPIQVTTTGSYPPRYKSPEASIRFAVEAQLKANIPLLVDGQVRSDIVGIFAKSIGLEGDGLPYTVTKMIGGLDKSVVLPDLRAAAKNARGRPLKAHISGPTVIAENCDVAEQAPDIYRGSGGFNALVLDIAKALAQEANFLAAEARLLGIQYLQIDEPSFAFGADLKLAKDALELITATWSKARGGPIILHVCGDYGDIFTDLLELPVNILNVEIEHFDELTDFQINLLKKSDKKISFGVIPVNTAYVPSPERVAREVLYASDRCGKELVWGITPVCGMRLSASDIAQKRMITLMQAIDILEATEKSTREVTE
jgi:5-methyltetrahydropteroyltriglutamate--homocysteine methyltransferase